LDRTGYNLVDDLPYITDNLPNSILAQTEWGLDLNKYKNALKKLDDFDFDKLKEAAKNNKHT
jgi:hypothetical protein